MQPIQPASVRYIKLGPGDRWFSSCREHQRLELGHAAVPDELAVAKDWDAVVRHYISLGRTPSKAKDFVRELRDFYTLGSDCLWITFAEGALWWAFAAPEVQWLDGDGSNHGVRARRIIEPWRNTGVTGELLAQGRLSTRLTQVAAYRQTLCSVGAADYAVRRINGIEDPTVAKALAVHESLLSVAAELIAQLHWADFELLVDLIFTRNGWRRLSAVGGTQKDIDLAVEQPTTGERAFVQVKSKATPAVLNDYIARFEADPGYQRLFFICHSPKGQLEAPDDPAIQVWAGPRLAQMTVQAGLFDWLIERVG